MSRLADRLAAMAPPPLNLTREQVTSMPQPSPAVAAALAHQRGDRRRAPTERARRSRSVIGLTVDSFVSACSFIPYALVALGLRLVMARRVLPRRPDPHRRAARAAQRAGLRFSVVLPLQVKAETFGAFLNQYAALPVPPVLGAYLLSYAEFILPICWCSASPRASPRSAC